jgi:hypothetical protein
MMPTSQPSASVGNNTNSVASHSKGSNNIIPYIKENITPDNKLYQETDQTETEAFKKWFGDSKVVDEEGKPLVVYHGSRKTDIEIFESGKSGTRGINEETEGFFFSPIREAADNYAGTKYGKGKVYPVYLSIKNPYIAKDYIEIGRINKEKSIN